MTKSGICLLFFVFALAPQSAFCKAKEFKDPEELQREAVAAF